MNRVRYHVRWTGMDGLAHWVPPGFHRRWCDAKPIVGLNHEAETLTCLRCALRRERTRESWSLFKERREALRRP